MYTRIEDAASYALEQRSAERGKKNIVGELRRLLTRVFGREFMELSFFYIFTHGNPRGKNVER